MPESKAAAQTLLEVLEKAATFLSSKGVVKAKLDVELMMAHVLGCKRLELYLQYDRPMAEEALEPLRAMVRRRALREPLQHIIGTGAFWGVDIVCDARALIPRPETEELFDRVCAKLESAPAAVLDLGTGSGVLALAAAKQWPEAKLVAVDSQDDALKLAAENAGANDFAERIIFQKSDWFSAVDGKFDLIFANPPYLTETEWNEAAEEVKDFDPKTALVAGDEGCADLIEIIKTSTEHLTAGGLLALETGIAQHERLIALAKDCGFGTAYGEADLSGRPRYLFLLQN